MFDIFFFYMPHKDQRRMNDTYTLMQLMIESARQVGFCGEFFFYTHEDAPRTAHEVPNLGSGLPYGGAFSPCGR